MRKRIVLSTCFALLTLTCAAAVAEPPPKITQLSAELEMKDFHDTASLNGPLRVGVPVTLTFKNNASVTVTPVKIEENLIRVDAELVRNANVLYRSSFITRYNADAELSEKNQKGDLLYRLKLNPHTEAQK